MVMLTLTLVVLLVVRDGDDAGDGDDDDGAGDDGASDGVGDDDVGGGCVVSMYGVSTLGRTVAVS